MTAQSARQQLIEGVGVPVEEKKVKAGDINTVYLEAGSGSPLVLLHGAGAGSVVWHRTIGALSNHFRVVAPDIVGYGESDKPSAAYDKAFYTDWLQSFLNVTELQQVHLAGSSQGGAIALQFAIDHPERVKRLALVDSGGLGNGLSKAALLGLFWLNGYPCRAARRWMSRFLVYEKSSINKDLAEYSLQVLKKSGGTRAFWEGEGKAVTPVSNEQLRTLMHQTLIVWGENDRFIPITNGQAAEQLIPNAQFSLIPEAGHFPFLDRPFVFNERMIDFLKLPYKSHN